MWTFPSTQAEHADERTTRDTIFSGVDVSALDWDDDGDTVPGMAFDFGDLDVDVSALA